MTQQALMDILEPLVDSETCGDVVRVTASKAGIVLGSDYLDGCCYETIADFMALDGYYPDMINNAMAEARATLAKLAQ